jgi:nucleoside-diphosphate-sugar epimerase
MEQFTQAMDRMPQSVMIFGCGYVGTALAAALLARGVRVGALTRNSRQVELLRSLGVSEVLESALDDRSWLNQIKGSYESAVNCVSSAGGGIEGYQRSYVEGQRVILEWAKLRTLDCLVYTSSTSVYPHDGGVLVTEDLDTDGTSATGRILVESEGLIQDHKTLFKRYCILRLAGIYGPQRHYVLDQLRAGTSVMPGRGDYHLNLIHRDDVVTAILCTLSTAQQVTSGIYNLSDGKPPLKQELTAYLAAKLGIAAPVFDPQLSTPRQQRRGGSMPDRVIANEKFMQAFNWRPRFCHYREGYRAILNEG